MQFLFIVCQVEGYQNVLKLSSRQLAFASYKVFLKNKNGSWTSLPASFLHDFQRKVFILLYSFNRPNFIVCLPLLRAMLGNVRIVIEC